MALKTEEREYFQQLIGFLSKRGYPKGSILYQWYIGNRQVVDVGVSDPETYRPLAILEIKNNKNTPLELDINQVQKYLAQLEDGIKGYLAVPSHKTGMFIFYEIPREPIKSGDLAEIDLPSFEELKASVLSLKKQENKMERKRAIQRIELICWVGSIAFVAMLMFDILNVIQVTYERLIMAIFIVGLQIIPYASKLKLPGFEFEQIDKKREEVIATNYDLIRTMERKIGELVENNKNRKS